MATDVAVQIAVRPNSGQIDADGAGAVATGHALLVVQPTLDLHLLCGEDGALAAGTGQLLSGRGNLGRIREDQWYLALREGFLKAALAVDLLVHPLVHIVVVLEGHLALGAAEAL